MAPSELLTTRDAADLLRMSLDTVRRLLREGQSPSRKVGPRQWRIRRADLDGYLRGAPGPYSLGKDDMNGH
jgi:excisionase family DNA binding protein